MTDNNTPIDEDWLRSVGFGNPTLNGLSMLIDTSGDPVELFIDWDGVVALLQGNREDHVVINSCTYRTRGDVRRLCAALGVVLEN